MSRTRVLVVLSVLLRPLQFALYWASGFVPRHPRQWAFGCWSGHRFGDNAGAVFTHLAEHPLDGVSTVWITSEASICRDLKAAGHRAHLRWSPAGIWSTVRAGVFVYDSLPKDINYWLSRRAMHVHLRHGIGIKKIERAIDAPDHRLYKLFHGRPVERLFWRTLLPWHLPIPDLAMSCSPVHGSQAEAFYGVPPEKVRITGFARHDRLVATPPQDRASLPTIGPPIPADRAMFVYLPTFREGAARQSFDWDVLASAAEQAGVTIAVKLHYVDADRGVLGAERLAASDHLRLLDSRMDPTDAYLHADGMISDFSSAPFDFMLLDRPVVYYVPDLERFTLSRPLMFDLRDVAIGPLCTDTAELAEALRVARREGVGPYRSRVDEVMSRFHTYPPGGASQRVVEAIAEAIWGQLPEGAAPGRYDYLAYADQTDEDRAQP